MPATYAESFQVLERHGWLDPVTSVHMQSMAALRTRIAHGYATVEVERIWRELPTGIQAFDAFAAAIARRLGTPT